MQIKCLTRLSLQRAFSTRHYAAAPTGGTHNPASSKTATPGDTTTSRGKFKMCGWQLHNYGELEELQYATNLRMPQILSASECLVRVHATTVNPIDVAIMRGYGATVLNMLRCQPTSGIEFPITLGREFCGELVQRGMGANKQLQLGTRVWGVVPLGRNGAHAEYVAVPDYCLAPAPAALTQAEAASVLYAGLTAWSGIYGSGRLGGLCGFMTASGGGANKRVLVLGGSGSVGSLAIQMLKAHDVQVLATCSENATELVSSLGADYVVDYSNPAAMATLSGYAPYDIVLDCAGQGAQYAEALKFNFHQYITFNSPMLRNIDSSGLGLGLLKNLADLVETNAKALSSQGGLVKWGFFVPAPQGIELLTQLVDRKKLLPLIDASYSYAEMPEAFKKVQSGHLRGKVVVNLK